MRIPRARIWLLMLAVAVIAFGLAASKSGWAKYREFMLLAEESDRSLGHLRTEVLGELADVDLMENTIALLRALDTRKSKADIEALRRRIAVTRELIKMEREIVECEEARGSLYRRAALFPWMYRRLPGPCPVCPFDNDPKTGRSIRDDLIDGR